MQTYQQTFSGATTWVLNISGKYFVSLSIPTACNYRFYKQGKKLDLGDISSLGVGLEVGPLGDYNAEDAFDRVEVDITAAGTYKIGIGSGAVRYNNSVAAVTITDNKVAQVSGAQSQKTVGTASAQLLAANAARQSLIIQNRSTTDSIYIAFGIAATVAGGIQIGPGGSFTPDGAVDVQVINAIGGIAGMNVVVVEG